VTWQPIKTAPEGVEVMTKIDDERGVRNEQLMTRQDGLWWINGGEMYVYYTPTHWMRVPDTSKESKE
jgi:hypothetical protein